MSNTDLVYNYTREFFWNSQEAYKYDSSCLLAQEVSPLITLTFSFWICVVFEKLSKKNLISQ
jgi:hypothetical protein